MIRTITMCALAGVLVLASVGTSNAQRGGGHGGGGHMGGGAAAGGGHWGGRPGGGGNWSGGHPGGGHWSGGGHWNGGGHGGHWGGHGGSDVFVDVGPWWGWGWGWGWGPPYYGGYGGYYYPPYYGYPPVAEESPDYIEQAPTRSGYWYYCHRSHAYYPDVETCPEEWIKVPPP